MLAINESESIFRLRILYIPFPISFSLSVSDPNGCEYGLASASLLCCDIWQPISLVSCDSLLTSRCLQVELPRHGVDGTHMGPRLKAKRRAIRWRDRLSGTHNVQRMEFDKICQSLGYYLEKQSAPSQGFSSICWRVVNLWLNYGYN